MLEARREGQRGEARTNRGGAPRLLQAFTRVVAYRTRTTHKKRRERLPTCGGQESLRRGSTVGWIIVMTGIMLTGGVIVFQWKQRPAGHIAYWQQLRAVEQRKGEVASRLPNALERHQARDHVKAIMERIDGELSRLTGS
jgi:hypothetical protein